MKTGVVDYKAGNLRSIGNALSYLGADFIISDKAEELYKCDKLLFPGVGEANYAMKKLAEYGLDSMMKDFRKSGREILGICLGCQIILNYSQEGDTACLGLIPGEVKLFPECGFKIPEIGWNNIKIVRDHYLLKDIPDNSNVYFVHSYYPNVDKKYVLTETDYILPFCSLMNFENVSAAQFHPEKSGKVGLRIMKNFLDYGEKKC